MLFFILICFNLMFTLAHHNHDVHFNFIHDQFNEHTDAYLTLKTNSISDLFIDMQNVECIRCTFKRVASINYLLAATIRIDTSYPEYHMSMTNGKIQSKCEINSQNYYSFGENGTYELFIDVNDLRDNYTRCQMTIKSQANFAYEALFVAVSFLIGIAIAFILVRYVYLTHWSKVIDIISNFTRTPSSIVANEDDDLHEVHEDSVKFIRLNEQPTCNQRIKCIDTLRGISLSLMILVNYGSGGYTMVDHAIWNGLHVADTVFPCFIFLMGTSIPLSFNSLFKHKSVDFKLTNLLVKIVRRSCLLFIFGLLTSNNSSVSLHELRVFGVLQRFSISYLVCALMEAFSLNKKNFNYDCVLIAENTWKFKMIEIYLYPFQWLIIIIFTIIWVLITFLLPVDGCPTGYLGPGGLHENGKYLNCTGGAAGYIDRLLLGQAHVYQYPTCKSIYQTKQPFDPEGLLGCLTSCVLTYIGVSIGHVLIHYRRAKTRVAHFCIFIVFYGVLALILCKWSRDDGWIPINKNLWSLSYVLVLASMILLSLTALYLLIDKWNIFSGKPFLFMGKNSIFIYIAHIVFGNFFPIQFITSTTHASLLAMHLYGVFLWNLVAYYMDFKKIYINF